MAARPQQTNEADHHVDKVVQAEPAVQEGHISRVDPIGEEDIVIEQQGLHRAANQGREMARQWCYDEDAGLLRRGILTKVKQIAKRFRRDDLLANGYRFALDRYGSDTELGTAMRHSGVRQQLHRRCGGSNQWRIAHHRDFPGGEPVSEQHEHWIQRFGRNR